MVGGARVNHLVGHGHGGGGGARVVELNKPTMECESHSSNNCINGSNCCGVA
jgi:hypothetical protein